LLEFLEFFEYILGSGNSWKNKLNCYIDGFFWLKTKALLKP